MKRTTYRKMLLGGPARITVEKDGDRFRMTVEPIDREVYDEAVEGQNFCNGSCSPVHSPGAVQLVQGANQLDHAPEDEARRNNH